MAVLRLQRAACHRHASVKELARHRNARHGDSACRDDQSLCRMVLAIMTAYAELFMNAGIDHCGDMAAAQ